MKKRAIIAGIVDNPFAGIVDNPFIVKVQPIPKDAINTPARAGPINRAVLNTALLIGIADGRSRLPTNSMINESLAGKSTAPFVPIKKASISVTGKVAIPLNTANPSSIAKRASIVWVIISNFLLFTFSINTPATVENRKTGRPSEAIDMPTQNAESVSWNM